MLDLRCLSWRGGALLAGKPALYGEDAPCVGRTRPVWGGHALCGEDTKVHIPGGWCPRSQGGCEGQTLKWLGFPWKSTLAVTQHPGWPVLKYTQAVNVCLLKNIFNLQKRSTKEKYLYFTREQIEAQTVTCLRSCDQQMVELGSFGALRLSGCPVMSSTAQQSLKPPRPWAFNRLVSYRS